MAIATDNSVGALGRVQTQQLRKQSSCDQHRMTSPVLKNGDYYRGAGDAEFMHERAYNLRRHGRMVHQPEDDSYKLRLVEGAESGLQGRGLPVSITGIKHEFSGAKIENTAD